MRVCGRGSHHRGSHASRWSRNAKRRAPNVWPVSVCPFGDGESYLGMHARSEYENEEISDQREAGSWRRILHRCGQRRVLASKPSPWLLRADADRSCHYVQSLLPLILVFSHLVTDRQERFSRVACCSCLHTDTRQAGSDAPLVTKGKCGHLRSNMENDNAQSI